MMGLFTFRLHGEIIRPLPSQPNTPRQSVAQVRVQSEACLNVETPRPAITVTGLEPSAAALTFTIVNLSALADCLNTPDNDPRKAFNPPFDFAAAAMLSMLGGVLDLGSAEAFPDLIECALVRAARLGRVVDRLPPGLSRHRKWHSDYPPGREVLIAYDPARLWAWK
ncbi:hypothetical protein [Methylobacterium frigidaeris]|uniref:Uncharacterized protein n=1 Tax=Methylobacterium frigidaeris TaxID=2038277 RepID=A0AA37M870_9HYPH|nr:hypothetical protein [Methylobacterium frigidaeris]GJD66760.1 hypothetical protein MPEAHAMD_6958 [Methylobacterium frigidaeris]